MSEVEGRRRGLGCLFSVLVLSAGLGALGLGLAGLLGGGGASLGLLEEREEIRGDAKGKIAVIDISGVMLDAPAGFGAAGGVTRAALRHLKAAAKDDQVKGVLLQINSPGGSVTDADLIHREVVALQSRGKPVLVLMGDICASGGYYVSAGAREVWALPTTLTGSIGVVMRTLNVHALLDRIGVSDESVTSGEHKQIFSPTRPVTEAQRALMQGVVDELHTRFVEIVAAGRDLPVETVRPLADGRLFTARVALEHKLIDGIGYREEALDRVKVLAGEGPFDVVRYRSQPGLMDLLQPRGVGLGQALTELLREASSPRALYLYAAPTGR